MILLHRWKFFSNKGHDLNLERIPKIVVEINDTSGAGALFQPITDNAGNLVALEIVEPGIGFNIGGLTNIDIIDENGTTYNLPFSAFTFDVNGGFATVNIGLPPANAFTYPAFTYEGNLFFDKISTGLIENEHIFIIEEVVDTITNKPGYVYPRFNGPDGKIRWKWTDETTLPQDKEAMFLFEVDTTSTTIPFIQKVDNVEFSLQNGFADSYTTGLKYSRYIPDNDNNSIQINLGTSYPSEGIFERKLELWDYSSTTPVLLAEIYLRSEIIPEDERFLTILDNLGQKINREEEFIFRDSDINEALPDYELLNRKRKEFILEHSNITPFIGSYKAIFNVINWLGYNDLRLKEYWLNIEETSPNYNKYRPISIPFDLKQKGIDSKSEELLPSMIYKKTNLFGLYYDINRESGELDEFGIPETEDAFMFTNEEVLIKLFALKRYLKNKFLPLNARIIDIVGEGVYFERYKVDAWQDGTKIFDIKPTREAKFTCDPEVTTVVDLREFNDYDYFKPAKLIAYLNPLGDVNVIIEDGGYGYVGNVQIKFEGGSPLIPAIASATVTNGVVTSVLVSYGGSGYVKPPSAYVVPDSTNPEQVSTLISYIKNRIVASFNNNNDTSNLPDYPNLPVGAPVLLKTSSFDITWDELEYPWDSFYYDFRPAVIEAILGPGGIIASLNIIDPGNGYISPPIVNLVGGSPTVPAVLGAATLSGGGVASVAIINPGSGYIAQPTVDVAGGAPVSVLNTWDTIGIGEFYEVEWIVTGPNQFIYRKRDRADVLKEHAIIVPYQGEYDVELRLYDTDNNFTNTIHSKCFKAILPEATFTTFGRFTHCETTWDDMNMTWDEANFMWIFPVKHETTWDDMNLTWDDLDMLSYINQLEAPFPAVTEKEIVRLTETDRYLGNLTVVDTNTLTITVEDASNRPPVVVGDYIYFKRDDNTFRTQITAVAYGYQVDKIELVAPNFGGLNYTLEYDYLSNVSTYPWPTVTVGPPPSGTTCIAAPILNASLTSVGISAVGAQLFNAIDNTNTVVPATPVSMPGPTADYYFFCSDPEDITGTTASGIVTVETTNWSVQSVTIINPGSGYNAVPTIKIFDALFYPVISATSVEPYFQLTIAGPLKGIKVVVPGSGYLLPPPVTVSAPLPFGTTATAVSFLDTTNTSAELTVTSMPGGLNPTWDVLREIGQTILAPGNWVYDPVFNLGGIKVGDWLKLRSVDNVPKIKRLPVVTRTYNIFGAVSGIELNGDYSTQFRKGEKCKIYKYRNLVYGQGGLNPDEFNFNPTNNTITIYNPTFDPIPEIIPGYQVITVTNVDNTVFPPLNVYTQRFLVKHINQVGSDYVLDVTPIDGDITQIVPFLTPSLTNLEYQYWEFPAVIVSSTFVGPNTEVILNFNDWPEHENFDSPLSQWYMDYGIVSGDWAMQVTQVGFEGNDTIITVNDTNSELWRSSTSYLMAWRNFDEDYAETRFGTDNLSWDDFNEITWDDMCAFTWDMLEYKPHSYTGFRIMVVAPNGRIQWNEEPVFEFQDITGPMTTIQKLTQAVVELNATDNPGLSRFDYTLMPDSVSPTYIMATAKNPGTENLGYLRFTNGVLGEYTSADPTLSHTFPLNNTDNPLWLSGYYGPENKPANWSPLIRAYREWGIDPAGNPGWYPSASLPAVYDSPDRQWESQRIPYLRALGGPFTWEETMVSTRNVEIPIYTLLFFTASGCNIAGKTKYLWRIIDNNTGNVVVEIVKPYLIWNFSEVGEYDIELTITDTNGNVKVKRRKGFVKAYRASLHKNATVLA